MTDPATPIRLTDTATRSKVPLEPIIPGRVSMYVCGPTVYDRAHLGNARAAVVFDALYRLLRQVYGADNVTYVRNITDVDDKINAEAQRRQAEGAPGTIEELIRERSDETTRWYHDDMAALGTLPPTQEPRATAFIPHMTTMIEGLIAAGHAYAAEGHVLFRVRSYDGYGALSGRSVDDMIAGARVEVAPYKEDPLDFVLWKPSDASLPGWDSPWGRGRPGWHIECSAMAGDLLGPEFDIHGGGIDLAFPHHENEIAQSRCIGHRFARIWLHNEMLQVDGQKMSKSLGNFFTVRDLLDQGIPGAVIRFVLLSTHYRKPMDWTAEKDREATATLRQWTSAADTNYEGEVDNEFLECLADDLNVWEAIARLDELYRIGDGRRLTASAALLGFDLPKLAQSNWTRPFSFEPSRGEYLQEGLDYRPTIGVFGWGEVPEETTNRCMSIAAKWLELRRKKNWDEADKLRSEAASLGLELRADRSKNGINGATVHILSSFDPAALEALR